MRGWTIASGGRTTARSTTCLLHQAQMTVHNGPVPPQPVVVLEIPGALTNLEYFQACFYRERHRSSKLAPHLRQWPVAGPR